MHGPWVSVAAPGTDIISLDPANPTGLADQTVRRERRAPARSRAQLRRAVRGRAGRADPGAVREARHAAVRRADHERIKRTASHPAGPGGRNNQIGFGMVNPVGALTAKIPGEEGITADAAVDAPFEVPPAPQRDWTPSGSPSSAAAGGVGLLLLTLFIVHTVRRQRRDRTGSA